MRFGEHMFRCDIGLFEASVIQNMAIRFDLPGDAFVLIFRGIRWGTLKTSPPFCNSPWGTLATKRETEVYAFLQLKHGVTVTGDIGQSIGRTPMLLSRGSKRVLPALLPGLIFSKGSYVSCVRLEPQVGHG